MIIKGRSRGGSTQLAAYLMDKKNENATVIEITGTERQDLRNALREMEAVGLNATTSQRVLYHAQIAPAHADALTQRQYLDAADRLEKALGMSGQPRAVVLHNYQGHEHLHVVWSRTDVEQGKVISDSWDRVKHHRLCRELEREWDLEKVQSGYNVGGHRRDQNSRDREHRQNTRLREAAKESGQAFKEKDIAKKEILWCWENSATGETLAENLKQMGYTIAEGRTGVVVIDEQSGATYSLSRFAGVKREEARQKCADVLQQIPKTEELTQERKAGRHVHLSPRKAKGLLHDQLAQEVSNDTGNYEANKRRAMNVQSMTVEEFKQQREAENQQRSHSKDDPGLER